MSAFSIRLPNSLHEAAKILAKEEHISVNQFITLAVSEKLSVLGTEKFLEDLDVIWVSDNFSRKAPYLATQVYLRYELHVAPFLKKALKLGADYIATGHYVSLSHNTQHTTHNKKKNVPCSMLRVACDKNKDQSYFLWTLTQGQLKHCLFPIGDYTKPRIRVLAKKYNLPTADKPDSQGVCFIGKIDVAEFLKEKLGKKPGPILTLSGKRVGVHDGLNFYTIGQRKGIGSSGGGVPYYVARKDFKKNALIVAEAENAALFSKKLTVKNVNWISGNPPTGGLKLPLKCLARIRYRQPLQKARIMNYESGIKNKTIIHNSKFIIQFKEPQRAVTPGQSAVFYNKRGEMLGGGIIKY